jgi:FkbM family methyltransferase
MLDKYVVSYAQNREDVLLSAFFLDQKKGFYVDVGANDPDADSVTKYFYERGWHGINIEPNPGLYAALQQQRPRDTNINAGISDKEGMLTFREYEGNGLSTFSKETMQELAGEHNPRTDTYKDYQVEVKRLDSILQASAPAGIDFMKIDVEGYEYEVISSNDWNSYRPKVLCIEVNHIHKDWVSILEKHDYKKMFDDGLNNYYVDTRRKDIDFQYIRAVIGRPVVPAFAFAEMERLEQENQQLRSDVAIARQQNREKDDELARLTAYILEQGRLKNLLRGLVAKIDSIISLRFSKRIKGRKHYPKLDISDEIKDPRQVLQIVQAGDKRVFMERPSLVQTTETAFFKTAFAGYRWTKRFTFRALRYVARKVIRR